MPLLSVVTPVYNMSEYLDHCLSTVLNQTFTDFEVLLVDDGSTDQSPAMCDKYAQTDKRIRVFHKKNGGIASARNCGIENAKGEYIVFVDSDDYIHPGMFEYLINAAENEKVDIVVFNLKRGTDLSYDWGNLSNQFTAFSGLELIKLSLIGKTGKSWMVADKLFKRDCFNHFRLPEGRIYEDNATVYRILYDMDRVLVCEDYLYYYYTNESSTVNQKFKLKHLDYLLVLEEMIDFFTNHHEPELLDWANKSYLYSLADMYRKVHENCSEPSVEAELKRKLLAQYKQEKEKYPINMETYPSVIEVLKPTYAKLYWQSKALKQKLTGK